MRYLALALVLAACSAQIETSEPTASDGPADVVVDASAPDAPAVDASPDAPAVDPCAATAKLTYWCKIAGYPYAGKGWPETAECPTKPYCKYGVVAGGEMVWCCP